jgi:hypothetical protein
MSKISLELMMKNIYQILGAIKLKQEDFRFNILYTGPSFKLYCSSWKSCHESIARK